MNPFAEEWYPLQILLRPENKTLVFSYAPNVTHSPLPHNHHINNLMIGGADMIQKAFGVACKRLREAKGLSQERFALLIDMDRTYYASVESGKRNISIQNIKKIADGFEISVSDLFAQAEKEL